MVVRVEELTGITTRTLLRLQSVLYVVYYVFVISPFSQYCSTHNCSCKRSTIHTDVNAGIGVHIYGKERTDFGNLTLLWIYVAFAAFSVVLACVLFAVFTGEAIIFKRDGKWILSS